MSQFTKDVARELDRRQRRRKVIMLGVWGALIVAAIVYLRCGRGWGLGGKGSGTGSGSGTAAGTGTGSGSGSGSCQVRVAAEGTTVDGKTETVSGAVKRCKKSGHAEVVVTGDVREGAWKELCDALVTAKVAISVHGDAQVCPP